MPTYEYACKECGEHVEVHQSFNDPALTTCDTCGGPLRKVFGNIGITFKGSGFYKTDSRAGAKSGASSERSTGDGAKADGSKAESSKSDGAKSEGSKSSKSEGSKSESSGTSGGGSKPESKPKTDSKVAAAG